LAALKQNGRALEHVKKEDISSQILNAALESDHPEGFLEFVPGCLNKMPCQTYAKYGISVNEEFIIKAINASVLNMYYIPLSFLNEKIYKIIYQKYDEYIKSHKDYERYKCGIILDSHRREIIEKMLLSIF